MTHQTERRVIELGDRHKQVIVSDRVSYISQDFLKPGKNGRMSKVKTVYVGFDSFEDAHIFAQSCRVRCQVRKSTRTLEWDYEVKLQADVSMESIEAIAQSLDKFYPCRDIVADEDERGTGRDSVKYTLRLRKSAVRKLALVR